MISYNVHTEDGDLKGHVIRLAPNVLLVLSNYGLAHDLAVQNPHTQIIFRPYFGRDDLYNFMSTNQFVSYCRQWWQGEPNIWFHTNNEAGLSIELMRWEMSVAKIAPAGMKFVFGNPATGTFPDNVEGWKYADEWIRFCANNRDRIMIGLHEYFDVTPVITMPQWLQRITSWAGMTRPSYHCGRYRWLTDYCDMFLGGVYPKIVITEAGNDDLTEGRDGSDVNAFLATLGFKPRGWQTLQQIWQGWYGRQADITYFMMFKWLVENVYNHPAIQGLCIFAWTSDGAVNWGKFNVSSATNFRNLNEAYHAQIPSAKRTVVVTSNYTTNVRETGSTAAKILTKVKQGDVVELYDVMVGDWYKITFNGVTGFVRKDVIEFTSGLKCVSTAQYNVLVRNAPAMGAGVIGRLGSGASFVIFGTNGDWALVKVGSVIGYCNETVLNYKETP